MNSRAQAIYDWLAMLLLLAAPLAGAVIFGAVRLWSFGPLLMLSLMGALLCLLRLTWQRELRIPPAGLTLIPVVLYGAAAIAFSSTPYESRIELLRSASLLGAYWAWTNLAARRGRWRMVLGLALFLITCIALYGLVQYLTDAADRVLNLRRELYGDRLYGDRISGTYFCPNHYAHLLALAPPMALALLLLPEAGAFLRILGGFALVVVPPALYVSQSRSGWIGLGLGLVVTACLLALRRSRRTFWILLALLAVLLAGTAAFLWKNSAIFRDRLSAARVELVDGGSAGFRVNQWRDTLDMIRDRPLLGFGPGSYRWIAEQERYRVRVRGSDSVVVHAHNDYLEFTAEYGLVGAVLLFGPLFWLAMRLLQLLVRSRSPSNTALLAGVLGAWAASAAHALFDFNLHVFANAQMLVLLTGVAVARLFTVNEMEARRLSPRVLWLGVAPAIAAVVVLLAVGARTLTSHAFQLRADLTEDRLLNEDIGRMYQVAARIDPGNWAAWEGLGDIAKTYAFWRWDPDEKREQAELSRDAYARAVKGNPREMRLVYGLGRAELALDNEERGLALLREAAVRNPWMLNYRSQYALELRRRGRLEEALEEFRTARTYGRDPMIDLNIKRLEEELGIKPAKAQRKAKPPAVAEPKPRDDSPAAD